MGRVKDLNRKAKRLRLKERRLAAQGGDKNVAEADRRRSFNEGYAEGRAVALEEVRELAKEHRRMTHFVAELRKLA